MRRWEAWPLLVIWMGACSITAAAQVTRVDFERALGLQEKYSKPTLNLPDWNAEAAKPVSD